MNIMKDEWIAATDGTRICADVYLPDTEGFYPTLYAVSPYQKDLVYLSPTSAFRFRETGPIDFWVERGYAFVVADQRGTGKSEGRFEIFGKQEQQDTYDTIEWIARQPWSSGKVAMIGESAYSVNQWLTASLRPPHLSCVLIYNATFDIYRDGMYHGGIFSMGFFNFWSSDIRASAAIGGGIPPRPGGVATDMLGLMLEHSTVDTFWQERFPKVSDIEVPTLVVAFWSNVGLHLRGAILGYEQLTSTKKLLAPGGTDDQERFFNRDFLNEYIAPWYDHWLKDEENGVMDISPVCLDEQTWPLERAVSTCWYLDPKTAHAVHSVNDGSLVMVPPTTLNAPTAYHYPNPAWTVGTTIIENGIPQPVRGLLTFTSEPLEHDTEVTGPIAMVLYAMSDQTDAEFFVKISEQQAVSRVKEGIIDVVARNVPPPSRMVTRGWLKASHRELDADRSTSLRPYHTHVKPEPIEPGKIIRYDIEIWPTSYLFHKGNRIRLEIANGDSMVADGMFYHYYGHKVGSDLIYHDADHPSHVVLPIIPRST